MNVLAYVILQNNLSSLMAYIVGLSFGTGSVGPAFYGLGLKESLIILLIVDVM